MRYGIRRADDPLITESLKVVDHCLKYDTPYGPCWRRYNHDGYGQKKDGGPFDHWGQGRAWPLLGGERAHYELAAGHDVKPLITAFERFSSVGGMLPEQVWDHEGHAVRGHVRRPVPRGRPSTLVWAHAEYLKLLRSVTDGKIFDTLSVVADRYAVPEGSRTFRSTVDVFQLARPIQQIKAGWTLRIVDANRFNVTYTFDNWQTTLQASSHVVGYPGAFVDIPTPGPEAGGAGTLIFTLYWPTTRDHAAEHWLGRNLEVQLGDKTAQFAAPLESKPGS